MSEFGLDFKYLKFAGLKFKALKGRKVIANGDSLTDYFRQSQMRM